MSSEFKKLGQWLFNNSEDLINDILPSSESGDIRDTGYPLKTFEIDE